MEWLRLLNEHQVARAAFLKWLDEKIRQCEEKGLDVPEKERQSLKGTRDSYREIKAYIMNNTPRGAA